MGSTAEKIWVENPAELMAGAVFYVISFCALKYLRRDSAPLRLTSLKLLYNTAMSIFSLYTFYITLSQLIVNYRAARPSATVDPLICDTEFVMLTNMEWPFKIFYYSKYVEFVDTFFLVMAGVAGMGPKMTLHLYHHLVTPSIVYTSWFYPCAGVFCGPLTNSLVHVVMYAYYGISVVFPCIKKYGNLITYFQLLQFVGVIIYHTCFILPWAWECSCNRYQLAYNFFQYAAFLLLFCLFLLSKNRDKEMKAKQANGSINGDLKKE